MGVELGPYRMGPVLGSGGTGEVRRAWDTRYMRWVALKVLHPQFSADPDYRRRFRREAQIAAGLREPHVVPVHDFGEIDGQLFLDMRLVDGIDLGTLLRKGPLEPRRASDLITQIAAALDAAHVAGLVHRDVKPSNVMVGPDDFAYLTDFGIARPAGSVSVAENGVVIGTLAYMAPERLRGEPADGRSDVYSLACLLHERLTGRQPFVADDPSVLVWAHLHAPPACLTEDGLPASLGRVVARGMAKNRPARPATAGAFAAAVATALPPRATARLTVRAAVPPDSRDRPSWPCRAPGAARSWWGRAVPSRTVRRTLAAAVAAVVLVAGFVAVRHYGGDGIPIGLSPVAVAFTADGADAFIANAGSETVTVFDTRRRVGVAEVPLKGGRTVGAVSDPAGEQLFVATTGLARHALAVIDMRTSAVVARVALPDSPMAAPVVNTRRTTAFVPTSRGIDLVDLRTLRYVGTIAGRVSGLAPSADGNRLLMVNDQQPTAELVDVGTRSLLVSIPLGAPARSAIASPAGDAIYLGGTDPGHALSVVDAVHGRLVASVPLPAAVSALTVSRDGSTVFLALSADRPVVAAVRTDTRHVDIGWFMEEFADNVSLAVSPDRTQVYIANTDLGTLTIDDITRRP